MSESRTIFKRRADRYAQISNAALRDSRLRLEDKGLLAWVMSLPEVWTFRREHAKQQLGVGRDKLDGCINRLREYGYCHREQHRDEQGKMTRIVVYRFTDLAGDFGDEQPFPENPETGDSPFPEKPFTANQPPINKDREEKNIRANECAPACDAKARRARTEMARSLGQAVVTGRRIADNGGRWRASPSEIENFRRIGEGNEWWND